MYIRITLTAAICAAIISLAACGGSELSAQNTADSADISNTAGCTNVETSPDFIGPCDLNSPAPTVAVDFVNSVYTAHESHGTQQSHEIKNGQ